MNSKERRIRARINETLGMLLHIKSMKVKKKAVIKLRVLIDELIFQTVLFMRQEKSKHLVAIIQDKKYKNQDRIDFSGKQYIKRCRK